MIAVMNRDSTPQELEQVQQRIQSRGLKAQVSQGVERTVVGVLGSPLPPEFKDELELLPGVSEVVIISKPLQAGQPGLSSRSPPRSRSETPASAAPSR